MRRRGAAEILEKMFGMRTWGPIPITAYASHRGTHFCGTIIEENHAQAGCQHQPFLTGCDHHIDTPGVHLKAITAQRGDAISHQKGRMTSGVKRGAHRRYVAFDRSRGVHMYSEHGLDLVFSICAKACFDRISVHRGFHPKIKQFYRCAQCFGHLAPAFTKAPC